MMKILIATPLYPPDIGGPATYAKLLNDRLPSHGFTIKILSFKEVRNWPKVIRHLLFFLKVLRRGRGVDIIFTQDPVSTGLPSLLAAKLLGKKLVVRVAGDYAWEQASQRFWVTDSIDDFQAKKYGFRIELLRKTQSFVVRHSDTVITPSIYFKSLVSGWNCNRKKIQHIYNGIDFPTIIKNKANARQTLRLAANWKVLISVGRLVPWKGFSTLIEVVENLVVGNKNYHLCIIGDGPDRSALAKMIAQKGLDDNIHLFGALSRDLVFDYLSAGDVFVLNTSFESFSFQVVEAMMIGIPVVTTNIGNLTEIINNGESGILVTPNDEKALIFNIERLLSDKIFREQIITKARKKSQQFSIENTLNNLLPIFKKL